MSYVLLDGIPFYTKEEIDNEFSEGAVGDERARAEAAEQANAAAIEAEVTRATESENALQSQLQDVEGLAEQTSVELGAETIRAKAAENVNAGDIATERSRAIAAEGQIATDIITEAARATAAEQTVQNNVDAINAKIPVAASTQNQLADKAYVEDSIRVADASFRGSYATVSAIPTVYTDYPADSSGNKKPDDNDYIYVRDASGYQAETLTGCWKFKYTGDWDTDGIAGWLPEYAISDSVFTQAQVNALNSGADTTKIAKIATNESNISDLQSDVSDIEALIPAEATAQNKLVDKASVDTAIAAADKVFLIDIGMSLVSTITKGEVDAAISANKILILKAIPSYSNTPIFYYYAGINYSSGTYIFASIQKETTNNVSPTINFVVATPTGTGTSDTFTFAATRDTLQPRLSAGDGITIDNTNNRISAKLKQVPISGTVTTGYSFNAGQFNIIRDTVQAGSFVYGIASDGMLIFTQANNYNAYATRVSYTLNGENYTVTFDSAGVGISNKCDIPHTFEAIDAATTLGTVMVDDSRSYAIYGILSQYVPRIEVLFNDIQTSYKYRCATVYNASDTETYPIRHSSLKTGQLETINLAPHQIIKLYSFTGYRSICEHTIPLTGTDDQGNAFAYDVVVRD